MCCLQENISLVCHNLAGHVVVDSSTKMGGGSHTCAISIAILATLTRLVSSADIPRTTLAANLLLPNSVALSSIEYLLDGDPCEGSTNVERASAFSATVTQVTSTQSQKKSNPQHVHFKYLGNRPLECGWKPSNIFAKGYSKRSKAAACTKLVSASVYC